VTWIFVWFYIARMLIMDAAYTVLIIMFNAYENSNNKDGK